MPGKARFTALFPRAVEGPYSGLWKPGKVSQCCTSDLTALPDCSLGPNLLGRLKYSCAEFSLLQRCWKVQCNHYDSLIAREGFLLGAMDLLILSSSAFGLVLLHLKYVLSLDSCRLHYKLDSTSTSVRTNIKTECSGLWKSGFRFLPVTAESRNANPLQELGLLLLVVAMLFQHF